jgi:transposase
VILFEDEASFRQDATLHATWAKRGFQPLIATASQRTSVKVFDCVNIQEALFSHHYADTFNAIHYIDFLEKVARQYHRRNIIWIHDNAAYHKQNDVWQWFKDHRKRFEVFHLPPYSPEYNAVEYIWKFTRKSGTHNDYFVDKEEIIETLEEVFRDIRKNPHNISGYMKPFL